MTRRLLLLAATVPSLLGAAPHTPLRVEVTGVRDGVGSVRVAVCTADTFLKECPYVGSAPAHRGDVVVTVPGVPPGTYAAQAFHDDDGSGRLERPLFGLPRKGFGFSRDAQMSWGPPRFNDAAVTVGPGTAVVTVPLHYR